MSGLSWWLVEVLSRSLEPGERDVIRGDFAECGATGKQALRDVLGLLVRRQAALWMGWRPWLALAVLVPLGISLSPISRGAADGSAIPIWEYTTNWDWAYLTNTGLRLDLFRWFAQTLAKYLALLCVSWSGGFVLGFFSRRTIAVNGAVFSMVLLFTEFLGAPPYRHPGNEAVFSLIFYGSVFPLLVLTLLVLLPSFWGMGQALRLGRLHWLLRTTVWAVVLANLGTYAAWHWGWWQVLAGWVLLPMFAPAAPAGYLAVSALGRWRRRPKLKLKENHT